MIEDPNSCPNCGVSLIGAPIPEASRHLYGSTTHFRREIGIEVSEVYDGVLFFLCPEPDCNFAWPRWDEEPLATIGRRAVDDHNAKRLQKP